ncbi:MAG: NAD-dependent epimerase/dehydratase family protein [Candidatus Poseidoniaceae archaeon]
MNTEPTSGPHMLITGGAGLIGTASKTYFEQKGWAVTTLDLKECDLDGRRIDHVGDIVEFKPLQNLLADVDGILHLAAVSRVIDAELNKEECTRVNVNGTKRLLEAASAAGCKWFIFGSSREVYGEPAELPVREEIGVNPINHYGDAKVIGENMVRNHCETNDISHSILRFSNVYGHPRDHATRLINAFLRRALLNQPLEIHGGGQIFDFTYIDDTVAAIFAAAEYLETRHQSLSPIHILPGKPVQIEELAELIIEVTESDSEIVFTPGRDYDVEIFYGSPERMHQLLNVSCPTNIREGIAQCLGLYLSEISMVEEVLS